MRDQEIPNDVQRGRSLGWKASLIRPTRPATGLAAYTDDNENSVHVSIQEGYIPESISGRFLREATIPLRYLF